MRARRLSQIVVVSSVVLFTTLTATAAGTPHDDRRDTEARLQIVIDEMRDRLAIGAPVSASLVPANTLLVSVAPADTNARTFVMSFDNAFLDGLRDDDLRAVVAHELGHVWIFTHHPYLQTERLANTVAMRAVSRSDLERVYAKVWERGGGKGDLEHFLGH